ncbi:MAG TPA: Calx-beta domain-containing protein [Methylomirabilota bacterium]|nr:Calx-beta domain-containing protein [Methylomirabilota bacterium]
MKWLLYLALGLVIRLPAQTTITFDGPPVQPPNSQFAVQQYAEAGFVFKPLGPLAPAPPYRLVRNGGGNAVYPAGGSAYLQTGFGGSLEFFQSDGSTFDLLSVDLAEYSTAFQHPGTITFSGTREDGSTVTTYFVTDGVIDGAGPLIDFQTFSFGPEFSNLVRVEVPTITYSLDNLQVAIGRDPSPERTVVSVLAIDSEAREISPLLDIPENPAAFRVSRSGGTNAPLRVSVRFSGTASNGVDYDFLSNSVTIPAGSVSMDVFVSVQDDEIAEGTESVVLTLLPVPCMECYVVGSNSTAVAYILDNEPTNSAPTVWISRPHDGETFRGPTNIFLRAVAHDAQGGYDLAVEFFDGTNRIGAATFIPSLCPAVDCPSWDLVWSNAPPGHYTLTAKATDKAGAITVSTPVHITVAPTNPPPAERTVVSVVATDSEASEPGVIAVVNSGQFAVRRSGNLAVSIQVWFTLSGSALNGIDYSFISNRILIPAGSTQAIVRVAPLMDGFTEGTETVRLTLDSPVCVAIAPPPPECYIVGSPDVAEVFIRDGLVTNHPPAVQLNEPVEGSVFHTPTNILLHAFAQDAEDGHQITVEFFAGTNRLGLGEFMPALCPAPFCPYFALVWSNAPPGNHTLTARATDQTGVRTVSAPVHITVNSSNPPPPEDTVVSVVAIDSEAVEPGGGFIDRGQFAIRRTGNLSVSIPVSFTLSGSALNGIDYSFISNHITIPAGSTQTIVNVFPLGDGLVEGTEHVVLTLESLMCIAIFPPPPECYIVGFPGAAQVSIRDAATTNPPPNTVVTVVASDSQAREPGADAGDAAQFTIRRSGPLSNDLTVFFTFRGSASNGVDYQFVSNRVVIAAGATQAVVNVVPLADALVEGTETVVLALQPPVCAAVFPPPPGCYVIGPPSQATAFIADPFGGTNRPPIVAIWTPASGSVLPAHVDILIVANANDPDGSETVSTVEFFEGSNSLGLRTNYPTANPIGPFFLIWSNVAAGHYTLTARATDTAGASTISPAVGIVVLNLTNQPPRPPWPWPRLVIPPQCFAEIRTNGCRLLIEADTPMTCVVECSVDLVQWTTIYTNTLSRGAIELRDYEGSGGPIRFYRVRQE